MPLIWVRTSLQYDTHIVASTTVQKSRGGVSQPLNLSTRSNGMDLILEPFEVARYIFKICNLSKAPPPV